MAVNYYFPKLSNHYYKHVLGAGKKDKRDTVDIVKEAKHWQDYKNVKTEKEYLNIANENIENAKRVYKYYSSDGKKSINYQKELVQITNTMDEDEYDKLLTTCIDDSQIKSCFYRTMSYNDMELLTLCISLYKHTCI